MIKISLMMRDGRTNWEAQWIDPVTGKKRTRSTGTASKRDAERFRARLEQELLESRGKIKEKTSWKDFVAALTEEKLDQKAASHKRRVLGVLSMFVEAVNPATAAVVTDDEIADFVRWMRKKRIGKKEKARKISESTIKANLRCLRLALRWGYRRRFLRAIPTIEMPTGVDRPKGRAITREEFERMLGKLPVVIPPQHLPAWTFYLEGLWWSGLRLGESLKLSWDDTRQLSIDCRFRRPVFRIEAQTDKGKETRLFPVAPGFARLVDSVPEEKRIGLVFTLAGSRQDTITQQQVERHIMTLGRLAGVKVAEGKCASAHDLRRSFATRWAPRVKPAVLQKMLRHKSIQTTMQFYADIDAQEIASEVWHHDADAANTLANMLPDVDPDEENRKESNSNCKTS